MTHDRHKRQRLRETTPGGSDSDMSIRPDDSFSDSQDSTELPGKEARVHVKMFPKDKDQRGMPTSNSSSESDQKRERIHKDWRGHETTTKSFKTTRKKEDLRGGGGPHCGPFLRSYLNSQSPENQVPSSDPRRFKRDGNKTDCEDQGPRVIVRETRASRLRAAGRTPPADTSPCLKSFKGAKRSEKEASRPPSASPTFTSLNRKDVDKSHSRKSHLNRSHTSEGVYDDVYAPGTSNVRRRRSKNQSLESSPLKTTPEKSVSPQPTMGNTNGTVRSSQPSFEHRLNSTRKPSALIEKTTLRTAPMKKRADDPVDIAIRAEILAASTLKMINRLDEINKSRRSQEDPCRRPFPSAVINSENPGASDAKKVPSPDDSTAKGPRTRLRGEKPSPKTSPEGKKPDAKPSILKNKPPGASPPRGDAQKPVSILKRKSLPQDDSQSCSSPPVTFSPSVLKKETDMKRQGILKKRRSLDENEVMRRRSHSPDAGYDFKSILKTQRRSSMEELTRRSQSPDPAPQGILKRKSSKEEEPEDEPQGILKRKSLPCLAFQQHVRTSESGASGPGDPNENVRPILKKKSSSEEHSASDPSLSEVPKSILKKKTSLEAEEAEDKPMKPILKSSRIPSLEEPEGRPGRAPNEEPRPILKREDWGVVRRVPSRHERPHSSSDIDSELSAIFLKRRSLEFQPLCAINFDLEMQKTKRASSNDRLRGNSLRRPLSVAEKVNNLENFLEVQRLERERRNSPPGSPPGRKEDAPCDRECASLDRTEDDTSSSFVTTSSHRLSSAKSLDSNDVNHRPKSQTSLSSQKSCWEDPDHLFVTSSLVSVDSEGNFLSDSAGEKQDDQDSYYSVDSCGERISSLSLAETSREAMDAEDLHLLQKSGSVSAKTSLFKELENKLKAEAVPRRGPTGNAGINRRHEKKLLQSNGQRYHTQPVSTEEVELARKTKASTAEGRRGDDAENHEDELCTMSYKDRLRLFESTFSPKFLDPSPKKRGTRHRTQPVTTDEVETAKSQRSSASASGARTGDSPSGLAGESSKPTEDRGIPKGILKNPNEPKKTTSDTDSSDSERWGKSDLKESFQNLKRVLRKAEKEATSELKGILKQAPPEKRAGSSSEEEEQKPKTPGAMGANLAAILQRVESLGRGRGKEASAGPKYMHNAGISGYINRRNNSLIVKSQSHSAVSSVFQPTPPKCVFPDGAPTLNGEAKGNGEVSSSGGDETDEGASLRGALRRSTTQPLGPSEEGTDDDMSGCSIRERLARLKRSGELDWQRRKSHVTNVEDELSVITAGNYLFNEQCLMREKSRTSALRTGNEEEEARNTSSILADRLGKLDAAKEGWKKRIKPSDAVRFSVEGKMLEKRDSLSPPNAPLQTSPNRTPLAERKKKSPKAVRFRSKQCQLSLNSTPSSPLERTDNPIARSVSAPGGGKDGLFGMSTCGDLGETIGPVVTVPKNDDETFTAFFEGVSTERVFQERLEIKDEDLDAITRMKSSQLLVQKRNIKTQKRRATVRNPVKALAARLELQEYTEIKTGIAEKELKRMKIEKAAKNSNLAIEALAGLASQEDFTAVNLKKATEGGVTSPDAPYKDLMLLQVKGRRHVQVRLVEPVARNINPGDCFVLVTPKKVFHYVGEFANVIERSRGAEIASHVQQKGDLGCTATAVVTIGGSGRASREQVREFWRLLGGEPDCEREVGHVDEDELFESALVATNMIYEMVNDELVPVETYWGSIPKIEVLDPNKILVFDFGSEFYVWNGKNVSLPKRKVALKLAKELWEEGYDYTDCDLCPLTAASHLGGSVSWEEIPESEKAGPARPGWALFAKITQNMETVLFREKFLDWPDYGRVIRRGKKSGESEQSDSNGTLDVKPCDAEIMLKNVVSQPDLVLEGNHLGRGVRHFDEETRKCSEIKTQDVTVWHVNEYEYSEVPARSAGQFHAEDSYVVRWHYVITITGRELSGLPSKHLTTGRNRYAYFFWQGQDSPVNDKGAAACLTVELDKEHGPQVRVVQGFEPPAFLNLFEGGMVVHAGRRCSEHPRERHRLFICRGEVESEAALFEVPCSMRQLRSLAAFVLVIRDEGKVVVWYGGKAPKNTRKIALSTAKRLQTQPPEFEFKSKEITIREEEEGSESQEFIRALGGDNRQLYYSLLRDKTEVATPRLFHLTSVSGEFLFNEVSSPHLMAETTTPLPFLQSDLYSASQPALFLLDSPSGLWLWQGWWEESSESERGTGYIRFQAERRAAMTTAMAYWRLKYGAAPPKAYLIWAGLEPVVFTNQFPFWTDRDDVAEINMKDGRKPGEAVLIRNELASLTQSTYPLAQLQNRPLPDGVNPTSLEEYLEPQCFPDVFGMEKEEFLNLPSWKKKKLKQDAGLF